MELGAAVAARISLEIDPIPTSPEANGAAVSGQLLNTECIQKPTAEGRATYNAPSTGKGPATTLHCITIHYITLCYITLHYITLPYIASHYFTLRHIALRCIPVH